MNGKNLPLHTNLATQSLNICYLVGMPFFIIHMSLIASESRRIPVQTLSRPWFIFSTLLEQKKNIEASFFADLFSHQIAEHLKS